MENVSRRKSNGTGSLFSDRIERRLGDIVENADAIAEYIAGMTFDQFASDRKTIDAVERCLSRIAEAVIQIGPDEITKVDPAISTLEIRGFGNFLRHEYFRVDLNTVFRTATDDVPELRVAALAAIAR